ncbi:MAG TPA: NifU family protein [Vicinamibacterales bacterium]|jgi:Fe-S cluster biogenesis protein NfuA|nr:NifU family protein [Vicinamibacterales bacterium]
MVTRERVETVLSRIRPFLVADGGDIQLIDVDGASATVRLTGACAGCATAHITLHLGIEAALREAIPDFGTLRVG